MHVGRERTRRGVSAQFDKPSEPERRQAPRQVNRLPRGWRRRAGEEERKAEGTENQGSLRGK